MAHQLIARHAHDVIVAAALSAFAGVLLVVFQLLLPLINGKSKKGEPETENFDPRKLYVGSFIYNGSLLNFLVDDSRVAACPLAELANLIAISDKFRGDEELVFKLDELRDELSKLIHVPPEHIRNLSLAKQKLLFKSISAAKCRDGSTNYASELRHA